MNNTNSVTVTYAIAVFRNELLAHGEVYNGFKASLKTAIEKYCTCGLPFEPEEETACSSHVGYCIFHIGFSISYITGRNRKEKQSNSIGSIYTDGNMFCS